MEIELDDLPVIDWALATKLAGNKRELAEDLLAMLMKDLDMDIAEINRLYFAKDYVGLRKCIHKLYGGICYCGVPRLKTVIAAIETDLRANSIDNLPHLIQQFEAEVHSLLKQFAARERTK